jgi:cell division protein FtsB
MSADPQLMKLKEEREQLAKEVDLIKKAAKPAEAADRVVTFIKQKEDPFMVPADNEWASNADKGGCCVVM